jgi:hypothetical protein
VLGELGEGGLGEVVRGLVDGVELGKQRPGLVAEGGLDQGELPQPRTGEEAVELVGAGGHAPLPAGGDERGAELVAAQRGGYGWVGAAASSARASGWVSPPGRWCW